MLRRRLRGVHWAPRFTAPPTARAVGRLVVAAPKTYADELSVRFLRRLIAPPSREERTLSGSQCTVFTKGHVPILQRRRVGFALCNNRPLGW